MSLLTVNSGPEAGRRYELGSGPIVLGRHPECAVVIDVGAVSRHHAQVVYEGGRYFIEDLNSRNGTFLNEQPVAGKAPLAHGDHVRICDVTFTFQHKLAAVPNMFGSTLSGKEPSSGFTTMLVDDDE